MPATKVGSLTPKQELYCQEFIRNGGISIRALDFAYPPKKTHVNAKSRSAYATRIFSHPAVQERIKYLQDQLADKAVSVSLRSAEDIIAFAEKIAMAAAATGKYSASNGSLALIAKILGVAKPEKLDVHLSGGLDQTHHYDLSGVNLEQRRALLQSLVDARKPKELSDENKS
jgi:hypothetical protein